MKNKFRLYFVITGLGTGGAEMMLYKVLSGINREIFDLKVVSLMDTTTLRDKFEQINIPVEVLGMPRGIPDPRGLFRLVRLFRKERPDLVQTWMYHADLLGGLAAKMAGNIPVVWNTRHSNLDPRLDKWTTILTAKLCGFISPFLPRKIICCAEKARETHVAIGYDPQKMIVIHNGFDLSQFRPDGKAREKIQRELSIAPDAVVIGLVARYHPHKDHKNFLEAAELLIKRRQNVHFLLCGLGVDHENKEIGKELQGKNLGASLHLLGIRNDMPTITAAFDIATSASCTEAFSNAIGEAMACGVPAVVTDVGDSAFIVGNTGKVVPPGKPEELSRAWQEMIDIGKEEREKLGDLARERVQALFSLETIVGKYEKIYRDILSIDKRSVKFCTKN